MGDWKDRLKVEYKELKERLDKLHKWNIKNEVEMRVNPCKKETIEDDQNRYLCREQEEVMAKYMNFLELRAGIYGINLQSEESDKNE